MFKKIMFTGMVSLALLLGLANMTLVQADELAIEPVAANKNERPNVLVERISREVLETARTDKDINSGNKEKIMALVEKKILPYVDFEQMTKLAAGRNWRNASLAQQQELIRQFRGLLVYTYSGALSQVKDHKLQYQPFRASDADVDVEVRSEVISARAGEPIALYYRLHKGADGWKIYDINVLGAWLIETYKGNFTSEINKSGIDGLIEALKNKNAKLATTFGKKSA